MQTVAVLDTVEGVYVWRGRLSDTCQHDVICRACEEYCLHKPLPVGRKVIKVREGHEPLVFRARFQAWDDGGPGEIKKFQDVYEQRMVQMSVSGGVYVVVVWRWCSWFWFRVGVSVSGGVDLTATPAQEVVLCCVFWGVQGWLCVTCYGSPLNLLKQK